MVTHKPDKVIQQNQFDGLYRAEKTPWDPGRPDYNLIDAVTQTPIESCTALDIGCGRGHNAIWLAQNGFVVTGVDVSETALGQARENALQSLVSCTFLPLRVLDDDPPGAPFGLVFDRGFWHLLDNGKRMGFAEKIACWLDDTGLWLSIIGSADDPPRGPDPLSGPPRRSAYDIAAAVEPYFEILKLSSSHFDSNNPTPPKAWVCLMKKRKK